MAEATKAAQRAGIEHAKTTESARYLGRKPSFTRQQFAAVRGMLGQEVVGVAAVAKETGLSRQTVYIANILKCRPDTPGKSSGNRKPTGDEMKTCLPYLLEQINIIRPKLQAFYASLSDEQKARFNTMGPPPQNASAQQRQDSNQ